MRPPTQPGFSEDASTAELIRRLLDGCPRCGYAYEREAGYFLIAIWGIHYFTVTGLGLAAGLVIDTLVPMPLWALVVVTAVPTVAFGFVFSRYAKSLYLAIDHYFDPHVKPRRPHVS